MRHRDERGFTLVELLAVMMILSIVSIGFFSVLFSSARSSNVTRSVVQQSEEARLAFNRMVRDIREADRIDMADSGATKVHFYTDFDGDGNSLGATENPNGQLDYEDLNFTFSESAGTIALNGEILIVGVSKVGTTPLFSMSSSKLEYDANPVDGVVTLAELQTAQSAGASVDPTGSIDVVDISFQVTVDGGSEIFHARAQLRNKR